MQSAIDEVIGSPARGLLVKLATCNLAQQALNFKENTRRIKESIVAAHAAGCTYRLGPELEITGYGCEDHFYEMDTTIFSWVCLKDIMISSPSDILCDVGMPVMHNGVLYNCRVFYMKGSDGSPKIILIRPKMYLAEDGNYNEGRWFTGWPKERIPKLDEFTLPDDIKTITGQITVPFGVAIVEAKGITIASEICEELFIKDSPNIIFGLEGVDIVSNGSGSHFQLGKLPRRHELMRLATSRNGGIYMYANQLGCDGGGLVFDGDAMIYQNGDLLVQGKHLSFHEVEMVMTTVNIDTVRTFRAAAVSRNIQAVQKDIDVPRVYINSIAGLETFDFVKENMDNIDNKYTAPISSVSNSVYMPGEKMTEMEELCLAIARYLWDYLILSSIGGFFLPLSGDVDSSSTALLIYIMCDQIIRIINTTAVEDVRLKSHILKGLNAKILSGSQYKHFKDHYNTTPPPDNTQQLTTRDLVNIILHTGNMPTENNNTQMRDFAEKVAHAIGSYHINVQIEDASKVMKGLVTVDRQLLDNTHNITAKEIDEIRMNIPKLTSLTNGDWQSNLALQHIQSRLRMLTAYYYTQILPAHRFNEEVLGKEVSEWYSSSTAQPDSHIPDNIVLNRLKDAYHKDIVTYSDIHDLIENNRPPALSVLASLDESIRGLFTKYDTGGADINPIGSFSKDTMKRVLLWCAETVAIRDDSMKEGQFNILHDIVNVIEPPEIIPIIDKVEITYEDYNIIGGLQKRDRLGPLGIFKKMCDIYIGKMWTVVIDGNIKEVLANPIDIFNKVKLFFKLYALNRHKMNIMTNTIHATSPDDSRNEHLPFIISPSFELQMTEIETLAKKMMKDSTITEGGGVRKSMHSTRKRQNRANKQRRRSRKQ